MSDYEEVASDLSSRYLFQYLILFSVLETIFFFSHLGCSDIQRRQGLQGSQPFPSISYLAQAWMPKDRKYSKIVLKDFSFPFLAIRPRREKNAVTNENSSF